MSMRPAAAALPRMQSARSTAPGPQSPCASRTLRARPGFTLTEVLISLVMTGIIGAAVTSVFITQTRFYDRQEKVGSARGVSRAAMNILVSELRMIERVNGVAEATPSRLVLRVPYVMGVTCGAVGGALALRYMPTDPTILADTVYSGHAWLGENGVYNYVSGGVSMPNVTAGANTCASAGIAVIPGGGAATLTTTNVSDIPIARPVFMYMSITYEFRNSAALPGRRALWRRIDRKGGTGEELVAPFSNNARFRFYIDDAATAVNSPPDDLDRLTGIEIIMDGLSERPDSDGTYPDVPLSTSIFFKNRI